MTNLIKGLEKRYDAGWMQVETTTGADGEKYHELTYDSKKVAYITETSNAGDNVYKVEGLLGGSVPFCEQTYTNPTEEQMVDEVDAIIHSLESF